MKKSFVSIRPRDIPNNMWLEIVLICPSECRPIIIPRKGNYLVYKAYFTHTKDKREFDIVFHKTMFDRAIKAVPPSLRQNLNRPIQFKFKKTQKSIFIKDWKEL